MSERHDSAWWRNQYPGWPSMSRERMEMLFSDLAATEAERDTTQKALDDLMGAHRVVMDERTIALNNLGVSRAIVQALRVEVADYRSYYEYRNGPAMWSSEKSAALIARIEARRKEQGNG